MQFDSVEQKNYVIQAVASCREWTHQQSLQLSQRFDQAIQNGEVVEAPKEELPDLETPSGSVAVPESGSPPVAANEKSNGKNQKNHPVKA